MKKIYKVITILLLWFIVCNYNSIFQFIVKADTNCEEIIFEPWNAIEVQDYSEISVPYLAGLASQSYTEATFLRVDVYRLESDGSKTLISFKPVSATIQNTFDDEYLDYNNNLKQIKGAEPYWIQDSVTQEYSYSYNETLKEALGYSQGSWPSTNISSNNFPIIQKCFFSFPIDNQYDGSNIHLSLDQIFTTLSYGTQYVLLFDGVFKYTEQSSELHIERPVTIYYTTGISWKTEEAIAVCPEIENWNKGDGHLHSSYSDGYWKWIYDYVGRNTDNYIRPSNNDKTRQHKKLAHEVIKEETIAYSAANRGKMDWIIMTDHANYLFSPQQPGQTLNYMPYLCDNLNVRMKPGNPLWFSNYLAECRSAEKEITTMAVIPMEEIAVNKGCRDAYKVTDCITQEHDGAGHLLNYNLLNGPEPYNRLSGRIADNVWGGNGYTNTGYGKYNLPNQLIRDEINEMCSCKERNQEKRKCYPEQPDGLNGWGIIAHPANKYYPWECSPKKYKQKWFEPFNVFGDQIRHTFPSVIRSYLGSV